jgi:hypothetical protein
MYADQFELPMASSILLDIFEATKWSVQKMQHLTVTKQPMRAKVVIALSHPYIYMHYILYIF